MQRTMLKSKIHRAHVTDANPHYEGSVSIDAALMKLADILPEEQVHLLDVDNGQRLITYAIEAPPNSGEIVVNGAAARLISKGDTVIILAYGAYSEAELAAYHPKKVYVDDFNRPKAPPLEAQAASRPTQGS